MTTLLQEIVNKNILERSRAAIDEAKDLLPVFVPTGAYQRAFDIVRRHKFAVLEGPPEMGKTAIARVLGMAQLLHQWEVFECRKSDDFFHSYDHKRSQLFIADDAFGHTEYEPDRVADWERDLSKIFSRLDRHHWFLWTSRKHILERARRKMDPQGKADKFPEPAEVLIDAGFLTTKEKALILYRHARAAGLSSEVRGLIRANASLIVNQQAFTPERIRRFVKEDAASLTSVAADDPQKKVWLAERVRQAIQNPTKRMRSSYEALPPSHKWVLISLIEAGSDCEWNALRDLYKKHQTETAAESFERLMEELGEAFVSTRAVTWPVYSRAESAFVVQEETRVQWIHPSYRDLVIEELSADTGYKQKFLKNATLEGIKLAISDTGGASGLRKVPLIGSEQDWRLFRSRCVELAKETDGVGELLEILSSAAEVASLDKKPRIGHAIGEVCGLLKIAWDEGTKFSVEELDRYCQASVLADVLPPLPNITNCWESTLAGLIGSLNTEELVFLADPAGLTTWVKLVRLLHDNEPRFLRTIGFPERHIFLFEKITEQIEAELLADLDEDSLIDATDNAKVTAASLEWLIDHSGYASRRPKALLKRLRERIKTLIQENERLEETRFEEEHDEDDTSQDVGDISLSFDVDELFSDL